MEEINEIRHEFDEKIEAVKSDVADMKTEVAICQEKIGNTNSLIQQNNEVLAKLNDTIQHNQIVMNQLSASIEATIEKVKTLEVHVESNKKKIVALQEERNFNFIQWIKDNFVTILLAGGLIYSLVK